MCFAYQAHYYYKVSVYNNDINNELHGNYTLMWTVDCLSVIEGHFNNATWQKLFILNSLLICIYYNEGQKNVHFAYKNENTYFGKLIC